MPKRSNEFQRLVFLVKQQMASEGTVTESKMLVDRHTGAEREVDICIELMVAGHAVVVCIECRDRRRRADVTWLDEMKAKHERLPTNTLVLASRVGFTRQALKAADVLNIETIALTGLEAPAIEAVFGKAGSVRARTISFSPTKVTIAVAAVAGLPVEVVAVLPDNWLHAPDGTVAGTVKDYLREVLANPELLREATEQALPEHDAFEVEFSPPRDQAGQPFCLMKVDPPVLRPIERVVVRGKFVLEATEFPMSHARLGDRNVAWSSASLLGRRALLVGSASSAADRVFTLHVEPPAR